MLSSMSIENENKLVKEFMEAFLVSEEAVDAFYRNHPDAVRDLGPALVSVAQNTKIGRRGFPYNIFVEVDGGWVLVQDWKPNSYSLSNVPELHLRRLARKYPGCRLKTEFVGGEVIYPVDAFAPESEEAKAAREAERVERETEERKIADAERAVWLVEAQKKLAEAEVAKAQLLAGFKERYPHTVDKATFDSMTTEDKELFAQEFLPAVVYYDDASSVDIVEGLLEAGWVSTRFLGSE